MMKTLITIVVAALLSAGCIQNMAGLKDSLEDTEDALQETGEALNATSAALNATSDALANMSGGSGKKAPVARMSLFGGNGALVYKSSFQAEDPADILFVDEKSKLSAIAGESETLERGATIAAYAWTLNGKALEGASKATLEVGEPGLYTLVLTITDSNGQKDSQTVKLGVAPKPFDVTFEAMTGPIVGAEGQGQAESVVIALAADASKGPVTVQKVIITAAPDVGLDAILTVADAEGTVLGESDSAGHDSLDQTETIELGAIALGDLTVTLAPFLGADADGVPITVTVTFLPVIEGLGDAHGGHAGH